MRASADSASTATSRRLGARLAEDLRDAAVAIERAREQVDGLDLRVLALVGEALRAGDERLCVGRVSFEVNRLLGHCAAMVALAIVIEAS